MKQLWTGLVVLVACCALALGLIATKLEAEGVREICILRKTEVAGTSRLCYYACSCGLKVLNRKSWEVCPQTARFRCY